MLTVPLIVIAVDCSTEPYCSNVDAFSVGLAERIIRDSWVEIPGTPDRARRRGAVDARVYASLPHPTRRANGRLAQPDYCSLNRNSIRRPRLSTPISTESPRIFDARIQAR